RGDAPAAPAQRRPDRGRPPGLGRALEHRARTRRADGPARGGARGLRRDRRAGRAQPVRLAQSGRRRLAGCARRLRRVCAPAPSGPHGMTGQGARPFNPRVVLGLLLFGAIAFAATLYFIGAGETSRGPNDGGSHAATKGLTGYAAIAEILEAEGHEVSLSRSPGALDGE